MLKIAFHKSYIHPLEENHRFPMIKYELIPEQLLIEKTCTESNFFKPEIIDTELVLKTHQESIQKIIDNLSKLSMNIFLELSMKQKSFYLDIHPDSQDIPETIHQIFLNFVFYNRTITYI